MLGIPLSDTSDDLQLQLFIDINSATVARLCNRTFAREEVSESWRDLNCGHRVFLSHWPVHLIDIESVESPRGTVLDPSQWELEEASGKVSVFADPTGTINSLGAFLEPVVVKYWGGYNLPDQAPLPLKQAVSLLNVQSRILAQMGLAGGIHQMSHKEARISFHPPAQLLLAASKFIGSGIDSTLMQILSHYIRYEV